MHINNYSLLIYVTQKKKYEEIFMNFILGRFLRYNLL